MIVVATTIHNVPTCKATWITWPTNNSSQAAVFFRSKPMSPFQRAPVEATNDLYGIEPPLSPATLHFVYGSHWALCTGLLGVFFLMATSVGGPVLSVNSMVAMILRYCMYCWFLDLIFGWFVDGLLQSLKFIYSCFIHGLQIIQVMPSFDFGKIFSVDIFKDPKFHRVHSYIYTHLFEFADIYTNFAYILIAIHYIDQTERYWVAVWKLFLVNKMSLWDAATCGKTQSSCLGTCHRCSCFLSPPLRTAGGQCDDAMHDNWVVKL